MNADWRTLNLANWQSRTPVHTPVWWERGSQVRSAVRPGSVIVTCPRGVERVDPEAWVPRVCGARGLLSETASRLWYARFYGRIQALIYALLHPRRHCGGSDLPGGWWCVPHTRAVC